jgi:hypothetical protein
MYDQKSPNKCIMSFVMISCDEGVIEHLLTSMTCSRLVILISKPFFFYMFLMSFVSNCRFAGLRQYRHPNYSFGRKLFRMFAFIYMYVCRCIYIYIYVYTVTTIYSQLRIFTEYLFFV